MTTTIQPQDSTSRAVEQEARRAARWPLALAAWGSTVLYGALLGFVAFAATAL